MKIYIDYDEDDQTLYENRGNVEDALGFLGRLLRDDEVNNIVIMKVLGPDRKERNDDTAANTDQEAGNAAEPPAGHPR